MASILLTMSERDKDHIRGRRSVLDKEQVNALKLDRSGHLTRKRNRSFKKIIPLLAFAFIVLMIAREEIPAFSSAWERMFAPDEWLAKQTCQKAAIGRVEHKEFARILQSGEVNQTNDGLYIDRLVIGEMGQSGNEVPIEYSCYLDNEGKLVKLNRIGEYPVHVVPNTEP